jgi:hypothetical protein
MEKLRKTKTNHPQDSPKIKQEWCPSVVQRRDSPEISLNLEEIITMCIVKMEIFYCDTCNRLLVRV